MSFKTLLKIICIFMFSIIAFIFCFNVKYKSYIVPGTVFSKTTELYSFQFVKAVTLPWPSKILPK